MSDHCRSLYKNDDDDDTAINLFHLCMENEQAHSRVAVSVASDNLRKSSCCLGADSLLTLLGNYCHSHDIKTSITIGVVGKSAPFILM